MNLYRVFRAVRGLVPVWLYPALGPVYRWQRKRDLEKLKRSDEAYIASHPDVCVPNAELRANVVGCCDIPSFLNGGRKTADDIESALAQARASIESMNACLDFGCGCGRLLLEAPRRWPYVQWSGCDVDHRGVDWCAQNLNEVSVVVNDALPPLTFNDGQFDMVWCGSVFTHLDEARQDAWLLELCRVLSEDGYLVASIHGSNCWSGLPKSTVRQVEEEGLSSLGRAATRAFTQIGTKRPGTRSSTFSSTGLSLSISSRIFHKGSITIRTWLLVGKGITKP